MVLLNRGFEMLRIAPFRVFFVEDDPESTVEKEARSHDRFAANKGEKPYE